MGRQTHCDRGHRLVGENVYEALWEDPDPRTPEGQRLWQLFRDGKLGPSPSGIRDFGQRICQIEAEAAARIAASGEGTLPVIGNCPECAAERMGRA